MLETLARLAARRQLVAQRRTRLQRCKSHARVVPVGLLRRLITALHLFRTYLGWLLRAAFHCWFCAARDHQF